eukprot:3319439-Alexandrium_andersonii.AAC.1
MSALCTLKPQPRTNTACIYANKETHTHTQDVAPDTQSTRLIRTASARPQLRPWPLRAASGPVRFHRPLRSQQRFPACTRIAHRS